MGLFHYEVTTGYCRVKVCEKCGELLVTPWESFFLSKGVCPNCGALVEGKEEVGRITYKMFRKLPLLPQKKSEAIRYQPATSTSCADSLPCR